MQALRVLALASSLASARAVAHPSAANGKLGYALVWLGVGHARIRFVSAHLEVPDAFAFAPKGFRDPTTTAFATIIDFTFGAHFDGFWVGSGGAFDYKPFPLQAEVSMKSGWFVPI